MPPIYICTVAEMVFAESSDIHRRLQSKKNRVRMKEKVKINQISCMLGGKSVSDSNGRFNDDGFWNLV